MQRADLIVEIVAAFVEAAKRCWRCLSQKLRFDFAHVPLARHRAADVNGVEKPARIAVGKSREYLARLVRELKFGKLPRHGALKQRLLFRFAEALQLIDGCAGEQCAHDLKGGIFSRRPHKDKKAGFHVRQKCILLTFAEAVHFIDKHQRRTASGAHFSLGGLHGIANILDAAQNGGNCNEWQIESVRHQPGERRLADAGRPPQNHGVRPMILKRNTQRRAGADQMLLPHYFVERLRAHALGERLQHGLAHVGACGCARRPRCSGLSRIAGIQFAAEEICFRHEYAIRKKTK